MTLTRLIAFADNDTTSDAEKVLNAIMKVTDVSEYEFVGDGPYSKSGTKWVSMMKKYFDTPEKVKKLRISQGNHEHKESESEQTEKDIESWLPHLQNSNDQLDWLSAGQVGNVYVISGNTQDLDIEFKRDQYNWLASELQKAKQLRSQGKIDWIVYLAHKPFFTLKSSHSPYTAVRNNYKDIFRDAQVDFVIHGHNHNTQLWKPMIPSESNANGEGKQLFTYKEDGKTFDFTKDHGWLGIVTGHAGHEWNGIKDQKNSNVMHYRDSGLFGFTQLDFDGKKANVKSIDSDGKVHYEYNVSREGSGSTEPPTEEPPTEEPPTEEPPTQEGKVCPFDWHYEPDLGHCIPDLNPKPGPRCPDGYTWNSIKKICEKDDNNDPDPEPEPTEEPTAKLNAPSSVKAGQNIILDASQSTNADTVTITQTAGQAVILIDAGTWKKSFIAPNGNFSLGFQAIAKKGTKQSIKQIAIQVSTQGSPNPEPPTDDETVLWDSNIHLKVDKETKVTSTFGSQAINGKGIFMAASGKPRLIIRPNGEFDLEADKGHGRVYIQCQNYNARYEGEIRFNDTAIRNSTWRLRSRHNEDPPCENKFGGFGFTCERDEQLAEFQTESCHNFHENTIKKKLPKDIEVGKWLKWKYSVCDSPDKKSVKFKTEYDYNDGKGWVTVLEGSHNSPKDYYMKESDFLQKRSYTWLRVNNEKTGKVTFRNVKIVKIDKI